MQPLYPLRFDPIYQSRIWGGRRLAGLLHAPLPGEGPIGEAWLLSDRSDHPSRVANGALRGTTLRQLLQRWPVQILGRWVQPSFRFPLLLKFLDVRRRLSVQVHPSGEGGKTEAWIMLEAGAQSLIYAGLKPCITAGGVRQAVGVRDLPKVLNRIRPCVGDAILLPAGTIHSLEDAVVFEVQQNSDVTFRLYDWDQLDRQTGKARPLQVEQALACLHFPQSSALLAIPFVVSSEPVVRERLFDCEAFLLWRISGDSPFWVGSEHAPRVLVCLAGQLSLNYNGNEETIAQGDVALLPAVLGRCLCRPQGVVTLLEISSPELT